MLHLSLRVEFAVHYPRVLEIWKSVVRMSCRHDDKHVRSKNLEERNVEGEEICDLMYGDRDSWSQLVWAENYCVVDHGQLAHR